MQAFPKIFALGTDYIKDIFKEEVEVTEKVDGSQFGFGKINGELICRSKGKIQYAGAVDKLFDVAVDYVQSIEHLIPDNHFFYAEYLKNPHHNALTYNRVPKNNLILFGVCDDTQKFVSKYEELVEYANLLGIEVVPLIFRGKINDVMQIQEFLERESVLGGPNVEGVVVKNYSRPFLLGGQPIPLMSGKFVSEKFKEVHRANWSGEHTTRGKFDLFKESFRSEARWQKAVQHLNENGELENAPRDIGKLMKEVQLDIEEEEKENIKTFLWNEFKRDILSKAVAGLPEWYKLKLAEQSNFNEEENEVVKES